MYYNNRKGYYMNITNTTNSTTFALALVTLIVSSVAVGAVSSISTIQRVNAQMNNTNMSGSMGSNTMTTQAKTAQLNITTAAPPITPTMFKSMASQIHVDLANATLIAEKWAGNNSHAVSSTVGIQNGSPVYTIWVIDGNSGLHQIIVDPQNGNVLLAYQPMSMTGPFS